MAFQLRLEEVLQALTEIDHPDARAIIASIEDLTSQAARALAAELDVDVGHATYDLGFIAVPFAPKFENQTLPGALAPYDNAEEWEIEASVVGIKL